MNIEKNTTVLPMVPPKTPPKAPPRLPITPPSTYGEHKSSCTSNKIGPIQLNYFNFNNN